MHLIHFWQSALFEITASTSTSGPSTRREALLCPLSNKSPAVPKEQLWRMAANRRLNTLNLEDICLVLKCSGLLQSIPSLLTYTYKSWVFPVRSCVCVCTWCVPTLLGYCNWPGHDWLLSSSPLPVTASAHPLTHAGGPTSSRDNFRSSSSPLSSAHSQFFQPSDGKIWMFADEHSSGSLNQLRQWQHCLSTAGALVSVFLCDRPRCLWAWWAVKSSNSLNQWQCGRRVINSLLLTLVLTFQTLPRPLSCAYMPHFGKKVTNTFCANRSEYVVWSCGCVCLLEM